LRHPNRTVENKKAAGIGTRQAATSNAYEEGSTRATKAGSAAASDWAETGRVGAAKSTSCIRTVTA
jgi:hypothetical protein